MTSHKKLQDLERGKWYKPVQNQDWLIAFKTPDPNSERVGAFKHGQVLMFMFLELIGEKFSAWVVYSMNHNRVWVHLGYQDTFAYVSFRDNALFQEVTERTHIPELEPR